jgi:hypothetical protein
MPGKSPRLGPIAETINKRLDDGLIGKLPFAFVLRLAFGKVLNCLVTISFPLVL